MADSLSQPETKKPEYTPQTQEQYDQMMQQFQMQQQMNDSKIAALNAEKEARPQDVKFQGLTGPDGQLLPQFQVSNGSDYEKMATNQLDANTTDALSKSAGGAMGANAAARTAMATRGGMNGGAALRLAEMSQNNQANGVQDIYNQKTKSSQDIENKTFDIGREAEKANVGSKIANQSALNQFGIAKYDSQMKEWAAEKSAQSQANAANSGGKKGK